MQNIHERLYLPLNNEKFNFEFVEDIGANNLIGTKAHKVKSNKVAGVKLKNCLSKE